MCISAPSFVRFARALSIQLHLVKSLPSFLMTLHFAHCLHPAWRVGFCHHPALSNSGSCCPLHQEPGKSKIDLSLWNLSASCQSEACSQSWILLTFSGRFVPAYLSLELHYVGYPLSNLRLWYLPHVSYLSDEACAHRVQNDCSLFTESYSSCCSFFDRATPVKLCSVVMCMHVDCPLHQFLGPIQKGVRIPCQMHLVNKLKKKVIDVRRCLIA